MKELGTVYLDETGVLVYNVGVEEAELLETALNKQKKDIRAGLYDHIIDKGE